MSIFPINIRKDHWPSGVGRADPGSRGLICFDNGIYC